MLVLRVPEETEYIDRSLPTASWYDKYLLQPGDYPVEFTDIDHRPVDVSKAKPYYVLARVDAIQTEEYREARLLHHVQAETREMSLRTTVLAWTYAYNAEAGRPILAVGVMFVEAEDA